MLTYFLVGPGIKGVVEQVREKVGLFSTTTRPQGSSLLVWCQSLGKNSHAEIHPHMRTEFLFQLAFI